MAIDPFELDHLIDAEQPSEAELAKRKIVEASRNALAPLEWDAPHVVSWNKMSPEARAAAGAAALFVRWKLDTKLVRWDDRSRVAFAILPDPYVEGASPKVTGRAVPKTVEQSLAPVRAAFGPAAVAELQRFIRRRS